MLLIEKRVEVSPVDFETSPRSRVPCARSALGTGLARTCAVSFRMLRPPLSRVPESLCRSPWQGMSILLEKLGDGGLERIQFCWRADGERRSAPAGEIFGVSLRPMCR